MEKLEELPRRKLRYWCYRLKNAAAGGAKATGLPVGLRAHFEGDPVFGGWEAFGDTWDLDQRDPLLIVARRFSVEEEWNATLRQVVPELPEAPAGTAAEEE